MTLALTVISNYYHDNRSTIILKSLKVHFINFQAYWPSTKYVLKKYILQSSKSVQIQYNWPMISAYMFLKHFKRTNLSRKVNTKNRTFNYSKLQFFLFFLIHGFMALEEHFLWSEFTVIERCKDFQIISHEPLLILTTSPSNHCLLS